MTTILGFIYKCLSSSYCTVPAQMYDNIASLQFDLGGNGETMAKALVSAEGEMMTLRQPVAAEGRVEEWMTKVLLEMRRTNKLITKEAIFYYSHQKSRYSRAITITLAQNQTLV